MMNKLPARVVVDRHLPTGISIYGYTAAQMRDYAAQEVAAERERILAALPGGDSVDPQWVADLVRSGPMRGLYDELLYAVGNKYPGETRHQTALRYIQQAEAPRISATQCEGPAKE